MIKTNTKLMLTTFFGIMLFSNIVLAIPVPHQFYGSVTLNGNPAPDGSLIEAKIDGIVVENTTTLDGNYSFKISLSSTGYPGKTIYFYVDGNQANENHPFCLEYACTTRLDLTATSTGGEEEGGGGGGGVYVPPTEEEEEEITEGAACQEQWVCSEWSACEDGIQIRTCEDVNNCGTRSNEPFSTQPCTTVGGEEEGVPAPTGITGFFLGMPVTNWVLGIGGGVIAAIIIIFLLTRRRRKKKKR